MDVKKLKSRCDKAWQRRRLYDAELLDVYDYIMPYRATTGLQVDNAKTEGARRTDLVFDATAIKAAFRFPGRMQSEMTPIFQEFFALEAGPLMPQDDNSKQVSEQLQGIGRLAIGILSAGSFHMSSHEFYTDLYAGTSAMFMSFGDDDDTIVDFETVPIAEVALETGKGNRVTGVVWRREWCYEDIVEAWPKGKFSAEFNRRLKETPDDKTTVTQYTAYSKVSRQWHLVVFTSCAGDGDVPISETDFKFNPWLTPRFWVLPGEANGRGPAQLALPFVKTLNKARELALKAAAFSLFGVWMRRNDGVFNPDTARLEPMAMWSVGSTGGPLGPTLQRLPIPQDFDVSSVVIADEREQAKMALFDETLPPMAGPVRSPTEIAERMKMINQDLGGVYGRLTLEIVVPLVQFLIYALEKKGKLPTNIKIDQLATRVRVVAPIAAAQMAQKFEQSVNWLQAMIMTGGTQLALGTAKVEKLFPQWGRWLGVDEQYIRSEADVKAVLTVMAKIAAAEVAPEPAPEPPPQQAYVNGGGL